MSCLTELVNKSDIKMPKDRQFDKKIIQIDNMNWPLSELAFKIHCVVVVRAKKNRL